MTDENTEILKIIKSPILTYEMKVNSLAKQAENLLNVLKLPDEIQAYRNDGIICDLGEGNAPYSPRYIAPDYGKFLKNGSVFLELDPPENLEDVINNLMILYRHVPSVTTFPVYIGNLDTLLEPYIDDEEVAYQAIKRFLKYIDRTVTDSFCHANIGPIETKAGRLILRAERALQNAIPNISLKYDEKTSDQFALDAVATGLICAKPSFANHAMFKEEWGEDYAIVSCYNGLPIGGGSFTLVRLVLPRLAEKTNDYEVFLNGLIPDVVAKMIDYMNRRIDFIVNEVSFFESNFLSKEGLINADKFTAMFGMVGLAETVNHFMTDGKRFGHDDLADSMGIEILEKLKSEIEKYRCEHLKASKGIYLLHAQVGIDTDENISPGVRIPIGEEPEIIDHLMSAQKFHKYFPTGVGDIFAFDQTVDLNHPYVLDLIKGGFKNGMRYISFYGHESDVVRITGYLVKRSEIEKLQRGEQVLQDTVALGKGAVENANVLDRKTHAL